MVTENGFVNTALCLTTSGRVKSSEEPYWHLGTCLLLQVTPLVIQGQKAIFFNLMDSFPCSKVSATRSTSDLLKVLAATSTMDAFKQSPLYTQRPKRKHYHYHIAVIKIIYKTQYNKAWKYTERGIVLSVNIIITLLKQETQLKLSISKYN